MADLPQPINTSSTARGATTPQVTTECEPFAWRSDSLPLGHGLNAIALTFNNPPLASGSQATAVANRRRPPAEHGSANFWASGSKILSPS